MKLNTIGGYQLSPCNEWLFKILRSAIRIALLHIWIFNEYCYLSVVEWKCRSSTEINYVYHPHTLDSAQPQSGRVPEKVSLFIIVSINMCVHEFVSCGRAPQFLLEYFNKKWRVNKNDIAQHGHLHCAFNTGGVWFGLVWFHRPYLPLHSICINAYMQFTYSIKTNPSQKQMQLVVIVLAVDNFSIN